jgi:hypothetical protein
VLLEAEAIGALRSTTTAAAATLPAATAATARALSRPIGAASGVRPANSQHLQKLLDSHSGRQLNATTLAELTANTANTASA